MACLFWLSEHQFESIKPFFCKSRGVNRVDNRKVLKGCPVRLHLSEGQWSNGVTALG